MHYLITWLLKICTLSSQCFNALVLFGNVNETVSGRMYREKRHKYESIINKVFWFDPDHCRTSHLKDVVFSKMILEFRRKDKQDYDR